ncbi:MAG: type II toxin-antitoxin system RelE family toxin [Spirochaetota bacterium]
MYELLYFKDAVSFLEKNKQIKDKIKEKLSMLKDWPVESNNIKALAGDYKGYYRFRTFYTVRMNNIS